MGGNIRLLISLFSILFFTNSAMADARAMGYVTAGMSAYSAYTLGSKAAVAWGDCAGSFGMTCARAVLYTAGSIASADAAVKSLNFSDQFGPRGNGTGDGNFDEEFLGDDGLLDPNRIQAERDKGAARLAALDQQGYRLNGNTLETPSGNFPNTPEGLASAFEALGSEDGSGEFSKLKSEMDKVGRDAKAKIEANREHFANIGIDGDAEATSGMLAMPSLYKARKKKEKKKITKAKKLARLKRATASDYKNSPLGHSAENIFLMVNENYENADGRKSFFIREYEQ